jgi:hypothetical protein
MDQPTTDEYWQAAYNQLISSSDTLPPPFDTTSPPFMSPLLDLQKNYDIPQTLTPPNSPANLDSIYYGPEITSGGFYSFPYPQRMIMPQPYLNQSYAQHQFAQQQQMPLSLDMISNGGEVKEFKCPYFHECKKSFGNPV